MNPFPQNCFYGKRYSYNSLSPDLSTILTDIQTFGSGYCSTSYTDANGLHIIYHRTGSLQYPQSNDIFGSMDFTGNFEMSFDLKYVSIGTSGTVRWRSGIVAITPGYCDLVGYVGTVSSQSGIGLWVYPSTVFKNIPIASNGNWHSYTLRKLGNIVYGLFDGSVACSIAWPGYSGVNKVQDVIVENTSTGIWDFQYVVRNLRTVSNTGLVCLGGSISDLLKS